MISNELINNIFGSRLLPKDILIHGYILVIDGKIYNDNNGKFIFKTRDQLVKSFYNSISWVAKHRIFDSRHPNFTGYYWGREYARERHSIWNEFKRDLEENHNMEIVVL